MCASAVFALAACGDRTNTIYFSAGSYELYLSESASFTPEVTTAPRGREYVLTSSNPSIVSVNADGVSVTAHKEGIVTLKATAVSSDKVFATTDILVFTERASSSVPTENDGKYVVYFTTSYGSVPAQRVSPGECAVEPTAPYREGYVLFGWYKDAEYKVKYDFSEPVTSNIFLYALWAYDEPEFAFEVIDDEVVLAGFKYSFIPYEHVTLPAEDENGSPIVAVKENAFAEDSSLKSVTIPSTYREIGQNAFSQCSALESVTLADGLIKIADNAFADCVKLAYVDFGANTTLTEIGSAAFAGCASLTAAYIPDSVTEIGMRAFKDCSALGSVNIPSSLKIVREETFAYTAITEVDLKNVVSIYNQAFWGANKLETVNGGNSLKEAGSYVFGSLKSANAEEAAPWLLSAGNKYVFNGEEGATVTYLGNVLLYVHPVETKPAPVYVLPGTVSIAAQAFSDVNSATAVFLSTVTPTYGAQAFGYASGAPTVDIVVPSGATEKFTRAFLIASKDEEGYYVPSAYSLALIQKIYEFTSAPFDGIIYSRYPLKADASGVYFSKLNVVDDDPYTGLTYRDDAVYYVLHAYYGNAAALDMNEYLVTDATQRGISSRTAYLEKICAYAFSANSTLVRVYLPNRTLRIESYAFMECSALTALYMQGEPGLDAGLEFVPAAVNQNSFNLSLMPSKFKIYVDAKLYQRYISAWNYSSISSKIATYS